MSSAASPEDRNRVSEKLCSLENMMMDTVQQSSGSEYVDLCHICLLDLASFVVEKKQTECEHINKNI
jgi:hypothetical protein